MQVTLKGKPMTLEGTQPQVGEAVPDFSLKDTNGNEISKQDLQGNVFILSVFPDINTSVCATQTRSFNEKTSDLPGVKLLSISKNTKEEMENWCAANGINMEMLPDTNDTFGNDYGVNIAEIDKLARSVFVVDQEGVLVYKEVLSEMTNEPDYAAALKAAKELL